MDKYFGGASAAGEYPKSDIPPIINVWPKESDHYQIRLYNEWKIKLFESLEPALSVEFSFKTLKKRFDDNINSIRKENPHSDTAISRYTQDQIRMYNKKIDSSYIQEQFTKYGGAWDTSKKVIPNLVAFLKARAYYNYVSFLENEPDIIDLPKKYPDKYYAWYHKILIAKGKAEQFTPGAKQEIIDYGKTKYGTKGGFYQAFIEFDLTSRLPFVNNFSPKERKKWKERIIEISNYDIDVINYLKDFPN